MKLHRAVASGQNIGSYESELVATNQPRRSTALDRWALARLGHWVNGTGIMLRLWDGMTIGDAAGPSAGRITIRSRATLWRLLTSPSMAFGEAYTDGRIDVAGDLTQLMQALDRVAQVRPTGGIRDRILKQLNRGLASARRNIRHHYDIGNDFYRLWLDEAMVYTCAYYAQPGLTLEAAQRAKLDHICRKLALRPGDRVIEAGCGWGALAIHMAAHYGATVRAYNISASQLAYARAEAARLGVAGRVTFIDGDVRSIEGECDAFVSVGMLEHLGASQYRALGDVIARVIDPEHGRGLLHFIGRDYAERLDPWTERYIFPGGYAPVLSEVTAAVFEPHRMAVIDVENLRPHYAQTIHHWRERFERSTPAVAAMYSEAFVRMWRLYLAAAEAAFTTGNQQLFQIVFGRAAEASRRWTRAALYPACTPLTEVSHDAL